MLTNLRSKFVGHELMLVGLNLVWMVLFFTVVFQSTAI